MSVPTIEQIQAMMREGLIVPGDMYRHRTGAMEFTIPSQVLRDRKEEVCRKAIESYRVGLEEGMASLMPEGAKMGSFLDLSWKERKPLHAELWNTVEKIVRRVAKKAKGGHERIWVHMGEDVAMMFSEDMQRAFGGRSDPSQLVRLGGAQVEMDEELDPSTVVVIFRGYATMPTVLTNGPKNDWVWESYSGYAPALEAGEVDFPADDEG